MKHSFLLTLTFISILTCSLAQKNNRTYAITGKSGNNFFWADIKEIDIKSGKVLRTIFDADKIKIGKSQVVHQIGERDLIGVF